MAPSCQVPLYSLGRCIFPWQAQRRQTCLVIYKLPECRSATKDPLPRSQEHIFGITHHFEDGSKLLFTFIDRKLFFKAPVSRRAPRQAAAAPSRTGGLQGPENCACPPPPPRCAWRLNRTSTPLPTAALCKGSSFFNVFPFFLKRKTIYWSVRGFLPLKFFKAGRVLPDSVLCWPPSVGSLLDGSSLAKCSLRPHLWA